VSPLRAKRTKIDLRNLNTSICPVGKPAGDSANMSVTGRNTDCYYKSLTGSNTVDACTNI